MCRFESCYSVPFRTLYIFTVLNVSLDILYLYCYHAETHVPVPNNKVEPRKKSPPRLEFSFRQQIHELCYSLSGKASASYRIQQGQFSGRFKPSLPLRAASLFSHKIHIHVNKTHTHTIYCIIGFVYFHFAHVKRFRYSRHFVIIYICCQNNKTINARTTMMQARVRASPTHSTKNQVMEICMRSQNRGIGQGLKLLGQTGQTGARL